MFEEYDNWPTLPKGLMDDPERPDGGDPLWLCCVCLGIELALLSMLFF